MLDLIIHMEMTGSGTDICLHLICLGLLYRNPSVGCICGIFAIFSLSELCCLFAARIFYLLGEACFFFSVSYILLFFFLVDTRITLLFFLPTGFVASAVVLDYYYCVLCIFTHLHAIDIFSTTNTTTSR